jgi:non-specific serine/threonine protein kinase
VDWSYDLLTEPERALLRRLSVFVGGWSLEAAEQVAAFPPAAERRPTVDRSDPSSRSPVGGSDEILDLLTSLVDKSLVQSESRGGAHRYRMLETIRQYAQERLAEAGESEGMRERYQDWYADLAERAAPELVGPNLDEWMERLEGEVDNLHATIDEAAATAPQTALRIGGSLSGFWIMRGHVNRVQERLVTLLSRPETAAPSTSRGRALHGAGVMAYFQSDFTRMRALIEEGLAVSREVNDPLFVAQGLYMLGVYHAAHRRDFARARAFQEKSLIVAREHGEKWVIGMSLITLGFSSYHEGDLEQAEAGFQEGLQVLREVGNTWLMKLPLIHLSMTALRRGDLERAEALSRECLTLERPIRDRWGHVVALDARSRIVAAQGDVVRAARLLGVVEQAIADAVNVPVTAPTRPDPQQFTSTLRALLGDAAFEQALTEGSAMTLERAVEYALSEDEP